MPLSPDQQKAADIFMKFLHTPNEKEMVIKGFPGCGKSYLTKYLISGIQSSNSLQGLISPGSKDTQIHCTATTNKAAAVLSKASGEPSSTIHSLLGLKVQNNHSNGTTSLKKTKNYQVVKNTVLFIDEASQEDSKLLNMIRDSTMACKTVHIGDPYQLTDIREKECPVFTDIKLQAELTGSQRFAATGPIANLAAQLRKTIDTQVFMPIIPDGKVIKHCDGPTFQKEINQEFGRKDFQENDAKIVAWSNNKVTSYNNYVRSLHVSDPKLQVGEKVITNKPIFNLGSDRIMLRTEFDAIVTKVGLDSEEYGVPGYWVTLDNHINAFQPMSRYAAQAVIKAAAKEAKKSNMWSMYFLLKDFFADLRPIYASTVYKAQGSTYKKVFIDLNDIGKSPHWYVVARMLHVAITRASDRVYLYGDLPDKYGGVICP